MLQDMDSQASKEQLDKFQKLVTDILKTMNIEDDKSNIVLTLSKIESRLNYLAEARNFLHMKDGMLSAA